MKYRVFSNPFEVPTKKIYFNRLKSGKKVLILSSVFHLFTM